MNIFRSLLSRLVVWGAALVLCQCGSPSPLLAVPPPSDNLTINLQTGVVTPTSPVPNFAALKMTAPGTGGIARDLQAQISDLSANIKDYGAAVNASTNDSSAIQHAVDTKEPVWFPLGTTIGGGLTIAGDGQRLFGVSGGLDGTTSSILAVPSSVIGLTFIADRGTLADVTLSGPGITSSTGVKLGTDNYGNGFLAQRVTLRQFLLALDNSNAWDGSGISSSNITDNAVGLYTTSDVDFLPIYATNFSSNTVGMQLAGGKVCMYGGVAGGNGTFVQFVDANGGLFDGYGIHIEATSAFHFDASAVTNATISLRQCYIPAHGTTADVVLNVGHASIFDTGAWNSPTTVNANGASQVQSNWCALVNYNSTYTYLAAPWLTFDTGDSTVPTADADHVGMVYAWDNATDKEIRTIVQEGGTYRIQKITGTAAGLNVGTAANNIVQLNGSAKIPAVDGSLLTNMTKGQVGLGSVTNDAQLKASDLDTDGTLAANSDTKIASQKATRTYATAHSGGKALTDLLTSGALKNYALNGGYWKFATSGSGASSGGFASSQSIFVSTGATTGSTSLAIDQLDSESPLNYILTPGDGSNLGQINWSNRIRVYATIAFANNNFDANTITRLQIGEASTTTAPADLVVKGIGVKIVNTGYVAEADDGSTLTTASLAGTASVNVAHGIVLDYDGAGTLTTYIDGANAGTCSGGPTGLGSFGNVSITFSATNGAGTENVHVKLLNLQTLVGSVDGH